MAESVKLYRKALVTEVTGLLVVSVGAHCSNKMKLRSAFTTHLKYLKNELKGTLGAYEQNLSAATLLAPVLQTRVAQGLKLR